MDTVLTHVRALALLYVDEPPEAFGYPRGTEGHVLHFGQPFPQDGIWYQARGGTMRSGLLAVEFLLTDQLAGRGGFCAIAGSHKDNFPCPGASRCGSRISQW